MIIKILLILLGIPILLIPLSFQILKGKKVTRAGYYFLSAVFIFTFLQVLNEIKVKKSANSLEKENLTLVNKVDSLIISTYSLSDSILFFKKLLVSIDNQFFDTNVKLSNIQSLNDSLNTKIFETDRPILLLHSTKVLKSKERNNRHMVDLIFANMGKRSATNVSGKMYTVHKDTVFDNGSLPVFNSEIYPNKGGFTVHSQMKFNPDSVSLKDPIYYYFQLKYSDLIVNKDYHYETLMKLKPFEKGEYINELILCKEWELNLIKRMLP